MMAEDVQRITPQWLQYVTMVILATVVKMAGLMTTMKMMIGPDEDLGDNCNPDVADDRDQW